MFYDRFIQLCNERGIKPSRAAIEMGFQKSVVTRWKTSTPTDANKRRVADYFGVSVDYLLGIEKAATLSDDGWSARKKELYAAIDSMTEEQAAAFLALWEQFKGI